MNVLLAGQLMGRVGNSLVEFDGERWWSDNEETAASLNQILERISRGEMCLKALAERCCAAAGYSLVIISLGT